MTDMIVGLCVLQDQSTADSAESFVRTNLAVADHMVILFPPSSQDTEQMLYSLAREGLRITIWPLASPLARCDENLLWFVNRTYDQLEPDSVLLLDGPERLNPDLGEISQSRRPDLTEILRRSRERIEPACDQRSISGAFTPDLHLRHLKCDWPPFEYVAKRFQPGSVVDLGCGLGAYLRLLRDHYATNVLGVDGTEWSSAHFISRHEYLAHDLALSVPNLDTRFELSVCVETLEHLPEAAGRNVVQFLATRTSHAIVFSAAQPNQPGNGHITCREPKYWIEQFAALGWHPDFAGSLSLRLLATLPWFKRNLFLLVPHRGIRERELDYLFARTRHDGRWPGTSDSQTVIGFAGQRWSFNLAGTQAIPPAPNFSDDVGNSASGGDFELQVPGPGAIARRK